MTASPPAARKRASLDVFINAPFSPDRAEMFRAILFAVIACGYNPVCARDRSDAAEPRISKIADMIERCRFDIHDISMMESDPKSNLARMNMPLELGIALGAKRYGSDALKRKRLLVLEGEPNSYDISISDISGQDIEAHKGKPELAIEHVRNFLESTRPKHAKHLPGPDNIVQDWDLFQLFIPDYIRTHGIAGWDKMTHSEVTRCMRAGLRAITEARAAV